MTRNYAELGAAIAALGLDYKAAFVPQSQSRHADRKEPSLNWRVTIRAPNGDAGIARLRELFSD